MSRRGRWATCWVAVLACLAAGLVDGAASGAADRPSRTATTKIGSLTLERCDVLPRALCGSIRRLWDPAHPAQGRVRVGFVFVPASVRTKPALGTVVPHEGGPGYSTTDTATEYAQMYGAGLLRRHNLLLVDQRGTGRSQAINCPLLQDLKIAYRVAARRCALSLGVHADDYATERSGDDLSVVLSRLGLGAVDVYGDSYGSFFTESFTGRHPSQVRSLIVDGAYPTYGEDGWYATQGPAMRHSFELACARSAQCRNGGRSFRSALRLVLQRVRQHPWHAVSHDADGVRARVKVSGATLASVAYDATFVPTFYREMTAALRSAIRGDRAPLVRLVAEDLGGGTDAGDPFSYSEGLDAAVACHDYPQLYDMTASPAVRERQYAAALNARTRTNPFTYGPFTVHEYARSDFQTLDWCARWPIAPAGNPAGPPTPPPGGYPSVPVLVLSGELDSITTPAEGRLVAQQFPNAQQVIVRNSLHVTAEGDTDNCAQRLVRAFVTSPGAVRPRLRACAEKVEPIRSLGVFPRNLRTVPPAAGPKVSLRARKAGRVAALTVADVVDRWWNNYSGGGFGLHGGRWSYSGDHVVQFRLNRVKLVRGVAVSGRARWARYGERMQVQLKLRGAGPHGRLHGSWDTRRTNATAVLVGHLGGHKVRLTFPAP